MHNFIAILAILLAAVWHVLVVRLPPRFGLVKPNFRKKPILASYGLIQFPYIASVTYLLTRQGWIGWSHLNLYLAVMAAMWILGAIDDIWGSREVGGFKGHFKKLILDHKLTTGAAKAMGGGIVALVAGCLIHPNDPAQAVLAAMVIALATNTLNLLDLRPGRAVAVLFCGLGVTYILTCFRLVASPLIATIAVIAFVFGIADSRGKAMMGDSGSNSLGAALGLTIALSAPKWTVPAILLFAVIHVYSEKRSISELIERNGVLRAIDRYLGVR